jgi:hypothetical protein
MKKSHLLITSLVSLIIISILGVALVFMSFKALTYGNFIDALRSIEPGTDIKLVEKNFGKAMYTTTDPKWNKPVWYKNSFSVDIQDDEYCYVFMNGAWANQVIVVITDKNGKIKRALPRDT